MKKLAFACLVLLLGQSSVMASSISKLEGFVTKIDEQVHASTNYYLTIDEEVMRIEDFSGQQIFRIIGNSLFISLKNEKAVRIGEVGLDLASLKNREMTSYKLIEDIEVETILHNKKSPKIERYFYCGITGCGFSKRIIDRNERILSLKVLSGNEFCLYQNRANRLNGVLYPGKCQR